MKNERNSGMRQKLAANVIVIALAANIILTGINMYLTVQFNQSLTDLGFRSNTSDFTPVIVGRTDEANLGKPSTYQSQDGVITQTTHIGIMYSSFQTVSSHYAALTIRLKEFFPSESEYLSSARRNETRISYSDEGDSHTYVLSPGLTQIAPQLHIVAQVYVDPARIPPKGEPVQFSIGRLFLEAELSDIETQASTTKEFSANVFIVLEMPQ